MFFSGIIQAQNKLNHWISKNLMIISLKDISEKCFSLNVSVNASIKLLWVLGGLLKGTQALGHSEGIWTLERHSGTWGFMALQSLGHLGDLGTWALKALEHVGIWGTLFSKLFGIGSIENIGKKREWNSLEIHQRKMKTTIILRKCICRRKFHVSHL